MELEKDWLGWISCINRDIGSMDSNNIQSKYHEILKEEESKSFHNIYVLKMIYGL